jgi:hypothetical protein
MEWILSNGGSWDFNRGDYKSKLRSEYNETKWLLYIAYVPRIRSEFFSYDIEIVWESKLTPTKELAFAKAEEILRQEWPNIFETPEFITSDG